MFIVEKIKRFSDTNTLGLDLDLDSSVLTLSQNLNQTLFFPAQHAYTRYLELCQLLAIPLQILKQW